jgi:type I restriction-modification system DNA methylase subunit
MQEFKFQLMLAGKISGSAAIDAAVRERIHGRPLGEVLREGLQAHLQRKTAERDDMKTAFYRNEEKRTLVKPGQDDLLRDLNFHQNNLKQNLAKLEQEVSAAQAALARFENPAGG